jgi:hypothetical protein
MFLPVLNVLNVLLLRLLPLGDSESFELVNIESIHEWTPKLSGPPMFQIGKDGWFFRLRSAPTRIASLEDRRKHFEALEAAWEAARSGATPNDPDGSSSPRT